MTQDELNLAIDKMCNNALTQTNKERGCSVSIQEVIAIIKSEVNTHNMLKPGFPRINRIVPETLSLLEDRTIRCKNCDRPAIINFSKNLTFETECIKTNTNECMAYSLDWNVNIAVPTGRLILTSLNSMVQIFNYSTFPTSSIISIYGKWERMKYLSSFNIGWACLDFADCVIQDGNTISIVEANDDYHQDSGIPGVHCGTLSDMYSVVVVDIGELCYYASLYGKESFLIEFLAKEVFNTYSSNTIAAKVDPGTYQLLPYYTQSLSPDTFVGAQYKIVKVS